MTRTKALNQLSFFSNEMRPRFRIVLASLIYLLSCVLLFMVSHLVLSDAFSTQSVLIIGLLPVIILQLLSKVVCNGLPSGIRDSSVGYWCKQFYRVTITALLVLYGAVSLIIAAEILRESSAEPFWGTAILLAILVSINALIVYTLRRFK